MGMATASGQRPVRQKDMYAKAGKGFLRACLLKDSSEACSEERFAALRDRLQRDGYLFLRGYLAEESVIQVSTCDERREYQSTKLNTCLQIKLA